jgi:D-methionine transport system ATP-binding protein
MIEIEALTKTFHGPAGPVPVLREVSLSVKQGEVFGIIGRSGAGKSTLVRCIDLLERPTSGRVVVAGQEVTALQGQALRAARRRIGMVFQHFNLLSSRTALDNVALPLELAGASRREAREAAAPLLDLVGLGEKRDRLPAELSGGEKQRVGIARALASKPAVLLCDEATSALDPETTKAILSLIKDINRRLGLTVVLITHEMQVIKEICDRVAVLDRGEVVEQGPVFDVFTSPRAEVTRRFVRDLVDRELPPGLVQRLAAPGGGGNPVVRIAFTGPTTHSPVVSEAVLRHGVLINILHGTVDSIQGSPYGNLVVEAIGAASDVQAALDFIRSKNLKVEVLGHVTGDARAAA